MNLATFNLRPLLFGLVVYLLLFCTSCQTNQKDETDPLRHTKKLVKEGHATLYRNGAFEVPATHIKLIPPGPDAVQLAAEMTTKSAQASFLAALGNAKESVILVSDGTRKSFSLAKGLSVEGTKAKNFIQSHSRPNVRLVVNKSSALAKEIVGEAWSLGSEKAKQVALVGESSSFDISRTGSKISNQVKDGLSATGSQWVESGRESQDKANVKLGNDWSAMTQDYVLAYAMIPQDAKEMRERFSEKISFADFKNSAASTEETRKKYSADMTLLVRGTLKNYKSDIQLSVDEGKEKFSEKNAEKGSTIALLSGLGFLTKAILWDASIKPTSKLLAGSLGYVLVNGVAYPAAIVTEAGIGTGQVLVEVVRDVGQATYSVIAPNLEVGLWTLLSSSKYILGQTAAQSQKLAGHSVRLAAIPAAAATSITFEVTAKSSEAAVKYIGAPMTAIGVTSAVAVSGALVGASGIAAGGALAATTELSSFAVEQVANLGAAAVAIGGAVASTAVGAGLGIYEVGKSVVVPAGYIAGSGIVLSYGTIIQLSAQSLLAVADASYLVLSLEGPNYVIYAVKGKVSDGSKLAPGAVIDLQKLDSKGEEFYKVPIEQSEIKKVIGTSIN